MAQSFEQYQRRRLISSYFSVVFSIFLVLFLLGALGLFVINSEKISNDFKENIPMSVYFKDEANDTILNAFDNNLNCLSFDVVLKDISGVGIFPDYVSITNISNEYDFHYLQKLSHSVDEKDNIKIMYERLTKHNISDQYVQKQFLLS